MSVHWSHMLRMKCLRSPGTPLLVQQLVQANTREIIKAAYYWSFVREKNTGDGGFPSQRASNAESIFMFVMACHHRHIINTLEHIRMMSHKCLGISFHWPLDCKFKSLFMITRKRPSMRCITGLCSRGNIMVIGIACSSWAMIRYWFLAVVLHSK